MAYPSCLICFTQEIANHAHLAPVYEQTHEGSALSSANLPEEVSVVKD